VKEALSLSLTLTKCGQRTSLLCSTITQAEQAGCLIRPWTEPQCQGPTGETSPCANSAGINRARITRSADERWREAHT
jgi:hypothetical protein